jgi:hypothetical protein
MINLADEMIDSNEAFLNDNWFCDHGGEEYSDPVPNHEKCPHCGRKDYNQEQFEQEQRRWIEIEQNHDWEEGDL